MEKISGIIPTNSRVTSVDLKESSPVRPGAPSFGRNEVKVPTIESSRGLNGDVAPKALSEQAKLVDWRTKDADQAAVVQTIADKFFKVNTGPANVAGTTSSNSVATGAKGIEALGYGPKLGVAKESRLSGFADRGAFAPSRSDREAEFEAQLRAEFAKSKDQPITSSRDRISSSLIARTEPNIIAMGDIAPRSAPSKIGVGAIGLEKMSAEFDREPATEVSEPAGDAEKGSLKEDFYPRGSFIDYRA